jgi:prepilin-type N-terminal cleavage/methylation domain-containing protein
MRARQGFTMIELLIVIVIVAVLAAIAMPRFADSKRQALVAAMKSDLRNIVSAAESHFSDDGTYANYTPQPGSSGITITYVGTSDGWDASATHASLPGIVCHVARGPAAGTATEPSCN